MADRLEELESSIRELSQRLCGMEARLGELERRGVRAAAVASAVAGELQPARPAVALPQGTMALFGRTLLVLAGAYLVRALTEAETLPAGAGVALGLAYAVLWLATADREAGSGRRAGAVFDALAGCLVAFPLVFETTARFGLLGPRAAGAALVGFFGLALALAWHRGLTLVAWAATGLAIVTAGALLVAKHDLLASFLTLLAVAATLEWLAYRDRWLPLRWAAAVCVDAVAVLLAVVAARPAGVPEGYVPLHWGTAALLLLGLPALYVASLAARTLRRERRVTGFEIVQGSVAALLGFGGAWRVLAAHGGSPTPLGVLALLLAALCYAAAFAFAERRPGQGRNFYFYSTAGGALALAGANVVAAGAALPFALGALGLLAALAGRRFSRMTLRVHGALYLLAAAVQTGLLVACARALAGRATDGLPALAWVAATAAAVGWLVLATDSGAPRSGWGRAPQLLLGVLMVCALGKALQAALFAGAGERVVGDAGAAAVLRTIVLAALALGLALVTRRGAWPELGWLVYPLLALGGVKLLLQDLADGRPATLVLSLAVYGSVLVLAPRLLGDRGRAH